jgi:hypothetical protein
MHIEKSIQQVFEQLKLILHQLSQDTYTQPSQTLSNATIGQHVRHIIELFQCLQNGYPNGTINYENRKRDLLIETDPHLAISLLNEIGSSLHKPDKSLLLEVAYQSESDQSVTIQSNYLRELVYNLEHTVHHMALIRVGIQELTEISLSPGFGVASSTLKYRQSCAQ